MSGWMELGFVQDSENEDSLEDSQDDRTPASPSNRSEVCALSEPAQSYSPSAVRPISGHVPALIDSRIRLDGRRASHGAASPPDEISKPTSRVNIEKCTTSSHNHIPTQELGSARPTTPGSVFSHPVVSSIHTVNEHSRIVLADDVHSSHGFEQEEQAWPTRIGTKIDHCAPVDRSMFTSDASPIHRALRKRNPIQLHPYRLEIAKYKQTLQSRGVRPVQIITDPEHPQMTTNERHTPHDSDQSTLDGSSQSQFDLDTDSQPILVESRASSVDRASSCSSQFEARNCTLPLLKDSYQDDLPDVGRLLTHTALRLGNGKRRKVVQEPMSRLKSLAHAMHTMERPREELTPSASKMASVLPISPPPSSPYKGHKRQSHRAMAHVPTAQKPVTPLTGHRQTDHRQKTPQSLLVHSHAQDEIVSRTSSAMVVSSASSGDDDVIGEENNYSMQSIRRQIRGVLPASWLKLDQQAQTMRNRRLGDDLKSNPTLAHSRKGVAQRCRLPVQVTTQTRVISPTSSEFGIQGLTSPDRLNKGVLSNPIPARETRADLEVADELHDFFTYTTHDLAENSDAQNPKIAATSYNALAIVQSPRFNKGQHESTRECHSNSEESMSLGPATRKKARRSSKRPSRAHLGASILDSESLANSVRDEVPQFIRLASRVARSREDLGHHSPRHKVIRLRKYDDTSDAISTLVQWRKGGLHAQNTGYTIAPRSAKNKTKRAHESVLGEPGLRITQRDTLAADPRSGNLESHRPIMSIYHRQDTVATQVLHGQDPRPRHVHPPIPVRRKEPPVMQLEDLIERCEKVKYKHSTTQAAARRDYNNSGFQRRLVAKVQATPEPVVGKTCGSISLSGDFDGHSQDHVRKPHAALKRKRRPRRLDVELREYRQPAEDIRLMFQTESSATEPRPNFRTAGPRNNDKIDFPGRYDIRPLEPGTYFQKTTWIGSGNLHQALRMDHRDLTQYTRTVKAHLTGVICSWGIWSDDLDSAVIEIFQRLSSRVDQVTRNDSVGSAAARDLAEVVDTLYSILCLNNLHTCFGRPTDSQAYQSAIESGLRQLYDSTLELSRICEGDHRSCSSIQIYSQFIAVQLILIGQVIALRRRLDPSFNLEKHIQLGELLRNIAILLLKALIGSGCDWLHTFYEDNRRHAIREAGIGIDQYGIQELLVAYHTLEQANVPGATFWQIFNSIVLSETKEPSDAAISERSWCKLVSLLPLLEIDATGIFRRDRRVSHAYDNWELVRSLLSPLFAQLEHRTAATKDCAGPWIRAVLQRCLWLIRSWGWQRCELIIGLFFDYFAAQTLRPLRDEALYYSAATQISLYSNFGVRQLEEKSAFGLFLEILEEGLSGFRSLYPDKKVQSLVWRYVPNHGRTFPNDQPLLQADLQALYNHHELLCCLYKGSPPGFRPRISLLHSLVDHTNSHREACRLNVRCLADLASFQISEQGTQENDLQPFALWFADIIDRNVSQYKMAASEAEAHLMTPVLLNHTSMNSGFLKQVVLQNQAPIAATLVDAVMALRQCIAKARDPRSAAYLLEASNPSRAFDLFDPADAQACQLILEVLATYEKLMSQLLQGPRTPMLRENEESQDYGEWPDWEDDDDAEVHPNRRYEYTTPFVRGLFSFLSTLFGAEVVPEDRICQLAVRVWSAAAVLEVRSNRCDWTTFLDEYSPFSWSQLRNTAQHRAYKPFLLSSLLTCEKGLYSRYKDLFLTALLASLVERELNFRYQHTLLDTILRADPEELLLRNVPFNSSGYGPSITIDNLQQQRSLVLTTILMNMHSSWHDATKAGEEGTQLKLRYSGFVKALMTSMKEGYQGLDGGETDGGSYVEFIHKAIGLIQQYASDFCAVDTFFTNSVAFPLPAHDPTFLVHKLKAYAPKLDDLGSAKQFVSLVQNAAHRAAANNEQSYFAHQLYLALGENTGLYDVQKSTLEDVMFQAVLPPYFKLLFSFPSAWIVAQPVLDAFTRIAHRLTSELDLLNSATLLPIMGRMISMMAALQEGVLPLMEDPALLYEPCITNTLTRVFRLVAAMLPSADYMARATCDRFANLLRINWFTGFATFVAQQILRQSNPLVPFHEPQIPEQPVLIANIGLYSAQELKSSFVRHWTRDGDRYYFSAVGSWQKKQVIVNVGPREQERDRLLEALDALNCPRNVSWREQVLDKDLLY